MVVDDTASVRLLVTTILNTGPYQTLQAADGIEALRIASANHIDLLITDVEMPRMGGLDLVKLLKERGAIQRCLVISGSSLDRVRELYHCDPDVHLLAKPFGAAQLLALIRAILNT